MSGECEKCGEHCLECICDEKVIKKDMKRQFSKHRKMSIAYLQRKFKLNYKHAKTICESFLKEIKKAI